jgi:hypothetical protein
MTDEKQITLEAATASLRDVTSIRDFVAAVRVGADVTTEMLNEIENGLLAIVDQIGDGQ